MPRKKLTPKKVNPKPGYCNNFEKAIIQLEAEMELKKAKLSKKRVTFLRKDSHTGEFIRVVIEPKYKSVYD